MSARVEKAVEFMNGPLSCSQSVMCVFADEVVISFEDAKKISAPYAGGRKIKCGAVWGAELILSAKFGEKNSEKFVAEFEEKFQNKVGAINCRDIRGKNLYPCVGCVEESAKILEKMLA